MERIVLGYDGSPAAISALNWTAARSTRGMTKVDVVLVATPSTKDRTPGVERLAEAEAALRERIPDLEVELHRLDGAVTTSLAEAAEGADLVVIGIHTGHPIRAAANGWTPLRLSLRVQTPVCIVPAGWTEAGDPVTVGIADDDSSNAALAFGIAAALAALAGIFLGGYRFMTPVMGADPLLKALIVVVFGGISSISGPIFAAYVIGFFEAICSYYFGLYWTPALLFAALILTLMVKPEGLFTSSRGRGLA